MSSVPVLAHTCPHCGTVKSGFSLRGHYASFEGYVLTLSCGNCSLSIGALCSQQDYFPWSQGAAQSPKATRFWPKEEVISAPEGVPANVKSYFLQGIDSFKRRNSDAAGTMFRKALEAGVKALHPAGSGSLYERITKLPLELGVTPAMKQWAHSVRHLGADAAHEEDPFTQTEAEDIKLFAEVFLTQAFTLPARIPEKIKQMK